MWLASSIQGRDEKRCGLRKGSEEKNNEESHEMRIKVSVVTSSGALGFHVCEAPKAPKMAKTTALTTLSPTWMINRRVKLRRMVAATFANQPPRSAGTSGSGGGLSEEGAAIGANTIAGQA